MIFTDNLKVDLFAVFMALLAVLLTKHARAMKYWKNRGVPCPETSLFTGSVRDFFLGRKRLGDVFRDEYFEYKSKGHRYFGTMLSSKPVFTPIDLDIVKSILQTDFQHFHSHGVFHNPEFDALSTGLFVLDGAEWRVMRSKLSPAFTPGKIKMMHYMLQANADLLVEVAGALAKKGPVNIKDLAARFASDNISSCAFGLDVKCLKDPDSEFNKFGAKVFDTSLAMLAKTMTVVLVPHNWLRTMNFRFFSQDIEDYFSNVVIDTMKYREDNKIVRNDFFQMMIEMKNSDDPAKKLSLMEIIGQCFAFYTAGFETSATTTTFACYELARNQDIQDELREEINRVLKKHNGELTYEAVGEMELLDRVFSETLRLYPAILTMNRQCMKDYKIPGEDVIIEKGIFAMISVIALHSDPEYFPNPEKFDPERFTPENKRNIPQYAYLPFGGEGPRICIGARFGAHQTKVGIASLIKNFKITLNEKTKTPLKILDTGIVTSVDGVIWVNMEKIIE